MALTQIEQGMLKDGILTADTAGRLKMADAFVNAAKLASGAARANFGAGAVLQVVQASSTTPYTTTSNAFQATNHSVTITPSSATSKILVIHQGMVNGLSGSLWCWATMYRNGSVNLYAGGAADAAGGNYTNSSPDAHSAITMATLDSPATTSPVTYTVYFKNNTGSGSVRYNADGWKLYTIALEIAA